MPRFYFHLGHGNRLLRDDEGVDLPDRAAAREEAQSSMRELSLPDGDDRWVGWFLRVADSSGQFLHLPFDRPA